jgi:hypothetical protein
VRLFSCLEFRKKLNMFTPLGGGNRKSAQTSPVAYAHETTCRAGTELVRGAMARFYPPGRLKARTCWSLRLPNLQTLSDRLHAAHTPALVIIV